MVLFYIVKVISILTNDLIISNFKVLDSKCRWCHQRYKRTDCESTECPGKLIRTDVFTVSSEESGGQNILCGLKQLVASEY